MSGDPTPRRAGPYRLRNRLSSGSANEVWLARDGAGRSVVFKLYGEPGAWPGELQLLGVEHPGLRACLDAGRLPGDGRVFTVCEYVDGVPLGPGALHEAGSDALSVSARLLGALAFIHDLGLLHRDLKDDNLKLSSASGQPVILDFGLCCPAHEAAQRELSGTPRAMAPELFAGQPASPASDLWAAGLVLAEALLGRRLFEGTEPESMAAERAAFAGLAPDDRKRIGSLPLAALLERLLDPDPGRRPAGARAALAALPLSEELLASLRREELEARRRWALSTVDRRREALLEALRGGALWVEPFAGPSCGLSDALAATAALAQAVPRPGETLAARLAVARGEYRRPGVEDLAGLLAALADRMPMLCSTGVSGAAGPERASERRRLASLLAERPSLQLFDEPAPDREAVRSALQRWLGPQPLLERRLTDALPENREQLDGAFSELIRCGAVRSGAEGVVLDETAVPDAWPLGQAGDVLAASGLDQGPADLLALLCLSPRPLALSCCTAVLGEGASSWQAPLRASGLVACRRSHPEDLLEPADARVRAGVLAARGVPPEARGRLALLLSREGSPEDEDVAAAVAQVLGQAPAAEPDEALLGACIRTAAATLRRVGRLERCAALLRRGLAGAGPEAPERMALHRDLLDVLIRRAAWDEAEEALRAARAWRPDDPAWTVRDARVCLLRGRPREAAEQLADLDPDAMDPEDGLLGLQLRGSALQALGRLKEGLADVREALRRQGDGADRRRMTLLERAASIEKRMGRFDDAVRHYEACIALARELGHDVLVGSPMFNLGGAIRERGERRRGLKLQEEAVRRIEAAGDVPNLTVALNGLGAGWLALGNVDTARRYLARALALARRMDDRVVEGMVLNNTGRALAAEGRLDHAEESFARAMQLRAERGDRQGQAAVALTRGVVRLTRGEEQGAREDLDLARSMLEQVDSAEWQVAAELLQARLALQAGERLEALDLQCRAGEETLEAVDPEAEEDGPWLADLLFTRADCRERAGRPEEADSDFARALVVLDGTPDGPVEARGLVLRVASGLGRLERALSGGALDYGLVGDLLARVTRDLDRARTLAEVHDLGPLRPSLTALARRFGQVRHEGDLSGVAVLAERARTLERLSEINKALNTERDTQRLLDLIVDSAIDLTGAARGFIILFDGRAEEIRAARNISESTIHHPEFEISHSVARRVVQQGEPLLSANAIDDERLASTASISALNLLSVLCVPLQSRSRVLGAVYLDHPRVVGRFGEAHLEAVTALAEQAAIALENARMSEGLSRFNQELRASREEIERLNKVLASRLEVREAELQEARASLDASRTALGLRYDYSKIITRSARMHEILDLLDRITDTDFPVVIEGESGTGKELIARAIHFNGPRSERDFLSVNCAAIPESLIESELFGAVKGAFTGADRDRKGLFEQAHRGTLFMDEIGDMSQAVQKRLLRVLQDGEFLPVGGREARHVDVRVLCATHRDLDAMVGNGEFREDLFYRLAVARIRVPPLRDRPEDIAPLLDHFLRLHGGGPRTLEPGAVAVLRALPWPGNVRQLENLVMNLLLAQPDGARVSEALVRAVLAGQGDEVVEPEEQAGSPAAAAGDARPLRERMADYERAEVRRALAGSEGNKARAARLLGVPIRSFYKILDRLGL